MNVSIDLDTARPQRQQPRWPVPALRLAGPGLLVATAAIHLDLYLTGYRTIPTIGWLFLLQVIAGFGIAAAVGVTGSRLAAGAAALFALSTLGGYLLSVWVGLFGFREVRTTAGIIAGVIEVAAFAVLAALALSSAPRRPRWIALPTLARAAPPGARSLAAVAGLSVVALALLGVAAAGAGSPGVPSLSAGAATSAQVLGTARIGGVPVLTDAKGLTLYWFAPDTATKSACYGSCAQYWPPVYGRQKAGPGIPGRIGTIKRSDGTVQATYNGHPLYTYVGDSAKGQANGNNLDLNGGLWHEVVVSG